MTLKEKLEELKLEEQELLNKHKDKHFKSEEEGNAYIQENEEELKRLNDIQKEIRKVEWELMSPKEQKELLDYYEKIKEKHSDE